MGRVINLTFRKDKLAKFNQKEMDIMESISDKYNSFEFENIWTCENFYINSETGLRKNEFWTFVKVQGNELNSLLVFEACIEISKRIKNCVITLSDEGRFLLCNLLMKNGRVLPVMDSIIEDMQRYSMLMLFSKGFNGNILEKINPAQYKFSHEFTMDINMDNGYGDMTKYIQDRLADLKEIETAISKNWRVDCKPYFFNIGNLKPVHWFSPYSMTRKVDVSKFKDYEGGAKNLMDGFDGEGFGLSTNDSEKESYERIAFIQKLFSGMGLTKERGFEMEILKQI